MGYETTKAMDNRWQDTFYQRVFRGKGLDIGAGDDPLWPNTDVKMGGPLYTVDELDRPDDAEHPELSHPGPYDFIHSSHCLEDLEEPVFVLRRWAKILKPGGYLIFTVPEFRLYEHGKWPSIYNVGHKTHWTVESICRKLIPEICGDFETLRVTIRDYGYDYTKIDTDEDQSLGDAECCVEYVGRKR